MDHPGLAQAGVWSRCGEGWSQSYRAEGLWLLSLWPGLFERHRPPGRSARAWAGSHGATEEPFAGVGKDSPSGPALWGLHPVQGAGVCQEAGVEPVTLWTQG